VDGLKEFDPLTGEVTGELERVSIYANSHYITPRPTLPAGDPRHQGGAEDALAQLEAEGRLLEAQRLGAAHHLRHRDAGDHRFLQGNRELLALPQRAEPGRAAADAVRISAGRALLVVDESHVTVPQIGGMYRGDFARKIVLSDFGFGCPPAPTTGR
jgi:excinuclease ABC subunit B